MKDSDKKTGKIHFRWAIVRPKRGHGSAAGQDYGLICKPLRNA